MLVSFDSSSTALAMPPRQVLRRPVALRNIARQCGDDQGPAKKKARVRIRGKTETFCEYVIVCGTTAGLWYEAFLCLLSGGDIIVEVPGSLAPSLGKGRVYYVMLAVGKSRLGEESPLLLEVLSDLGPAKRWLGMLQHALVSCEDALGDGESVEGAADDDDACNDADCGIWGPNDDDDDVDNDAEESRSLVVKDASVPRH